MADNGYARYSGFGSGGGGGGGGTVTNFSFVNSNGFSGSVTNPTTTPALTLSTSFTGIAYSNGTGLQTAVAGNFPTLNQNTTGTAANITATSNSTLTTLSALSLPVSQLSGASNFTDSSSGADGITVTGGTGAVLVATSIAQAAASASQNGYLSSANFTVFNSKQSALTFADSLVNTSGTVTLKNDSASPAANSFYGTNGSSTLGYYGIPTSMGGSAFYAASSQVTTQDTGNPTTSFVTSSVSPALTFTPTVSGTYKIYASVPLDVSTAGVGACRVFNTSGAATLLQESQGLNGGTGNDFDSAYCQSVYTLTAGTAYVFDLQTKMINTGTIYIIGAYSPFYMFAEQVATGTAANLVIGTIDGNGASANGLSILASTLYAQSASSSNPGMVNNTSQTFAGSKTLGFNASDKTTIGAASSTAVHQINGGEQVTTRTVTASTFTVDTTTTDRIIYTDSTSNPITITLPAPTNGRELIIQDKTGQAATNNITINPHASETINGLTTFVVAANYGSCTLASDGTNWVATKTPTSSNSFITAGTTYTTPVNITPQTRFKFTLIGGGGSGAGNTSTANLKSSGGGAGGVAIVQLTGLSANTGYTIAIGTGGAGASGAVGNSGGNTTLTVGATTYTAAGGVHGAIGPSVPGGAGGGTTNATIGLTGGSGFGTPGTSATSIAGNGGSNPFGQGGVAPMVTATTSTGNAGLSYGGGGSGSAGGSTASAGTGGAGAAGAIIVEWWN